MKKIKRPYYPPATDPGATPKASGGGHQDTHGEARDPPSSPVQVKRASAEIAPSPERLAILPASTFCKKNNRLGVRARLNLDDRFFS